MDDRYQYQSRAVKAIRWLRWRPVYVALATYRIMLWLIHGAKPIQWADPDEDQSIYPKETRISTVGHIWDSYRSRAEIKMKHYMTCEEWIADLRSTKID